MPQKIIIKAEIDDDYADPNHPTGVTAEAHDELLEKLALIGMSDIDIERS